MLVFGEGIAQCDVGGVLALQHHVGAAHRVGLSVEFLAEDFQPRLRVEAPQMVLSNRQHAARPAGGVTQRLDDSWLGQDVLVIDEEKVHHEPDDLTRGEVLTCRLVRQFGEPADELLVEVAHLEVRHDIRMQVDIGELPDHLVEQVAPAQSFDLDAEVELLDDVACHL